MIRLEGVTKRYGATAVVDDVDLDLGHRGVTALIGPNGAGKSTVFSLVGRLLSADGGRVLVEGRDVARTPSAELARCLAVLRQDNHLVARLTIRELVSFGRFPHSRGRTTAGDREHVEAALAHLDLSDLGGRYLDEVSGGQRQRAFIAMVLAQDTPYVLLDEPLNNLDLRHVKEIVALLRTMADDLGRRVVVVLHDVNVAAACADRVVAMREGRVLADGPTAQVITSEVLTQVYSTDVTVREVGGRLTASYFD